MGFYMNSWSRSRSVREAHEKRRQSLAKVNVGKPSFMSTAEKPSPCRGSDITTGPVGASEF